MLNIKGKSVTTIIFVLKAVE